MRRLFWRFVWEHPHPVLVVGSVFLALFIPLTVIARLQAGDPVPNDSPPVTTAPPASPAAVACEKAGGTWVESYSEIAVARCQTADEVNEEQR